MLRCSARCLNFDDEGNCCIFGHHMLFNKKTDEYVVKECDDYDSIDELIDECNEPCDENVVEERVERIERKPVVTKIEREEDKIEFSEEEPKRVERVEKVSEKSKSDDELDEDFLNAMETGGISGMMKNILRDDVSDIFNHQTPEMTDEEMEAKDIENFANSYGEDEVEEDPKPMSKPAPKPKYDIQRNIQESHDIDEFIDNSPADEDSFSSIDDFVTTTEVIEGYGDNEMEAKFSMTSVNESIPEEPAKIKPESKQQTFQQAQPRGQSSQLKRTSLSAQFEQFAADVKSGKINLEDAYNLDTPTEEISEEERIRQTQEARKQMGLA